MKVVLAFGVCLALATQAGADPVLRLSDGVNTIEVRDGGLLDTRPEEGLVSFSGALGVFFVQMTVGSTKPLIGSPTEPQMDLFNLSMSSASGGTLTVLFTDTDFLTFSPGMGVYMSVGGTTMGMVSAFVKADDANAEFGGGIVGTLPPFSPGSFSADGTGLLVGYSGTYSMTLGATITHIGSGTTSFDFMTIVPEPSCVALLGSALSILWVRRRRRS